MGYVHSIYFDGIYSLLVYLSILCPFGPSYALGTPKINFMVDVDARTHLKTWFLVFWGSNAHFFKRGTHIFLFLNGFVIKSKITWDKKNGPFRLKSGYLTPKTLKSCFWGLKPIFSPVTPTSFFLNRFQMWFDTSFEEKNIPFKWKNVYETPRTP